MAISYASYAGLVARFGDRLVRSSFTRRGDTNAGMPDETTQVDPTIARVSRRIDGILGRYGITVPFTVVPSQVQDVTETWTLIEARRDGDGGKLSESDKELEQQLVDRLVGIGTGAEVLEGVDIATTTGPLSSVQDGRAPVWEDFKRDSSGRVINPDQVLPSLEKIL